MRYYPNIELDIHTVRDKLKIFQLHINDGDVLLSNTGLYKYNKNKIYKYNFNVGHNGINEDHNIVNKDNILTIGGIEFIKTPDPWLKENITSQIPYSHDIIKLKTLTFTQNKNNQIRFIVEKVNGANIDFYFETPEPNSTIFIKNDICLFLEKLK